MKARSRIRALVFPEDPTSGSAEKRSRSIPTPTFVSLRPSSAEQLNGSLAGAMSADGVLTFNITAGCKSTRNPALTCAFICSGGRI
jgi:hypothetical protein